MPRGLLSNLFFRASDGTETPVEVEHDDVEGDDDRDRGREAPAGSPAPATTPNPDPQPPGKPAPPPAGPPTVTPIPGVTSPPGQRAAGHDPLASDPRWLASQETIRRLEEESLVGRAEKWADEEVAAQRSLPAERGTLVASYVLAARDDAADAGRFAAATALPAIAAHLAGTGSRVAFLQATHAARPKHYLFREYLAGGVDPMASAVIRPDAGSQDGEADPAEVERLRKSNPTLAGLKRP